MCLSANVCIYILCTRVPGVECTAPSLLPALALPWCENHSLAYRPGQLSQGHCAVINPSSCAQPALHHSPAPPTQPGHHQNTLQLRSWGRWGAGGPLPAACSGVLAPGLSLGMWSHLHVWPCRGSWVEVTHCSLVLTLGPPELATWPRQPGQPAHRHDAWRVLEVGVPSNVPSLHMKPPLESSPW